MEEQVDEIRRLISEQNLKACDLAKSYGVAKSTISYLINNKTWTK